VELINCQAVCMCSEVVGAVICLTIQLTGLDLHDMATVTAAGGD